ncbi:DUF58 domain-containing protein [Pseudarthrobacter phenanthrenivorans]|uniref:DUF58 domain-containing protein n=2 Tax=Pseudarthrobacter phenanthrenivorans TaxID=361575 RepID=A0A3B0FWN2_PSEPS|nr:DUF58 domain-containing protein [Pseudarthrobacter phenanthrenivorans]ADX73308.1 uncharacterized conserved protein [Pseudarthrobacter phenanthrenivorans Sphe3]RKO24225.1 DUF58 domain-containing protein [Pseudarthrobacter phenanthrenivorans]
MTSLLTRVKSDMAIFAHRKARGMLDGEYGSVFRGRSLDFDDLRAYVPGDEVRDIDWKATARHGSPLIRRYVAVRRQTVLLVTDTGRNMAAVSRTGESKKDVAVMALGVMAYLAHRHGDLVGLVCGDSERTTALPAKGGEAHLERLLRQVDSAATLDAAPSRLEDQLDHVARSVKGRHLLFVVADEVAATAAISRLLRRLRAQHEILWLTIRDAELAPQGTFLPPGPGTDSYSVSGSYPLLSHLAGVPEVAAAYAGAVAERDAGRKDMLRQAAVTAGEVAGTGDVMTSLFALLERHRRAG